jgi:hypothetical protein
MTDIPRQGARAEPLPDQRKRSTRLLSVTALLLVSALALWMWQRTLETPAASSQSLSSLSPVIAPQLHDVARAEVTRTPCQLRLIDAETRELVPSGTISFRWVEIGGQSPRTKQSFEDGAVVLQPPPNAEGLWLDASATGTATTSLRLDLTKERTCEIELHRRTTLRVEVQSVTDGSPVPGARIGVVPKQRSTDPRCVVLQSELETTTADDGSAAVLLTVGDHDVTCTHDGVEAPKQTVRVQSANANLVTFRVAASRSQIRGVVVEASSSAPLAGASVELLGRTERTDAAGKFTLPISPESFRNALVFSVRAEPPSARTDLHEETVNVRWHTDEVRIALGSKRLELEVVDGSGRGDDRWGLDAHDPRTVPAATPEWRPLDRIGTGRYALPVFTIQTRGCLLRATRDGEPTRYAVAQHLTVRDESQARVFVWHMPEPTELVVDALSRESGASVAGATVEVLFLALGQLETVASSRANSAYDPARAFPFGPNESQILAAAHTDASGRAVLTAPMQTDCYVRVAHADFVTKAVSLDREAKQVRVRLTPRPSACLFGTVKSRDEGVVQFVPVLAWSVPDESRKPLNAKLRNGAFAVDECSIGLYAASLVDVHMEGTKRSFDFLPLGLVEAHPRPGKSSILEVQAGTPSIVEVSGPSLRLGDHLLFLSGDRGVFVETDVGPQGRATARLREGTYTVLRMRPLGPRRSIVQATTPVDVRRSDAVVRVEPEFPERHGRIRLLRDGQPVRNTSFDIDGLGSFGWAVCATDDEGFAELAHVPAERFALVPSRAGDNAPSALAEMVWRIDGPCQGQAIEGIDR